VLLPGWHEEHLACKNSAAEITTDLWPLYLIHRLILKLSRSSSKSRLYIKSSQSQEGFLVPTSWQIRTGLSKQRSPSGCLCRLLEQTIFRVFLHAICLLGTQQTVTSKQRPAVKMTCRGEMFLLVDDFRRRCADLTTPNKTSVCTVRSCASSNTTTEYLHTNHQQY